MAQQLVLLLLQVPAAVAAPEIQVTAMSAWVVRLRLVVPVVPVLFPDTRVAEVPVPYRLLQRVYRAADPAVAAVV